MVLALGCGDDDPPPADHAPTVDDASVTTPEDTEVEVTISADDEDGDAITLDVEEPTDGTLSVDGLTVTYTPDDDFVGTEVLTVTATAGDLSNTAVLDIFVTPVNDPPDAVDDVRAAAEDQVQSIAAAALLANDTDPDGDDLVVTAVADPIGGTVALYGGEVEFTPTADFTGDATFAYTISDGALTDTASVTLQFGGDNDAPVAVDDAATTPEDTALVVTGATLVANDTDTEGQALDVTEVGAAINGVVSLASGSVTFTPTADFHGAASFEYTVSDGAATDTGVVTITVGAVNDAPVAVDDAATTPEDTARTLAGLVLTANDTDVDGDTLTVTAVGSVVNGSANVVGGDVVFTPTADYTGPASLVYTVSDGTLTDTATVTIDVGGTNDGPIAVDDSRSTSEDTAAVITGASLVANDTDVDGDPLTVTAVGSAVNGSAVLAAGTVTFTPAANFSGTASFQYTVGDGLATDTGLVTVTVTAVNDAPVAVDDSRSTTEDTAVVITGASLVVNDTDLDGGALSVIAVNTPVNGTVGLAAGNVTFTPTANFSGSASFEYTVSDGAGGTDTGLVTVTVSAINDAPVAVDDSRSTNEDVALVFASSTLVTNDTDIDGGALSVTSVNTPVNGTVGLAAGNVTFTPTANFSGSASFEYTVSDGAGGTDTGLVTVTVTAVNDAPVAVDDSRSTNEDVALVFASSTLVTNDTDIDGGALSVTAVGTAVGGTVGLAAGNVTFTPTANSSGSASFEYTVSDGAGGTDTGLVTVTVTAVNDAPVAVDDSRSTNEDVALVFASSTLVTNDTDIDGGALSVTAVNAPVNGTVGLAAGNVTFTPTANFSGSASFEYTVSDGAGGTDTGLVTVTVTAVNDAPVAVDDSRSTNEDVALVIVASTLATNDTDIDGGALSVTSVNTPVNGAVGLAAGNVTFTPTANFNGTASFQYVVSDGAGGTDTGLVTVTVNAVNDAPVAVDDGRSTNEDIPLVIAASTLTTNDTDVEGNTLTVTAVGTAVNGSVGLAAGNITFTPTANFSGSASFEYTVNDGAGGTDTGLVTVTVTAVNDAPVAVDDSRSTNEDIPLVIAASTLATNDTDVEGNTLTVTAVGTAVNGSVGLAAGNVTFTPTANFSGSGSFEYTVSDGAGGTDVGLVTVTINAVNDAPVAVDDSRSTNEDIPLVIAASTLATNDTDLEGNTLTVTAVNTPVNGAVGLAAGNVTFTPTSNFSGAASFQYVVSDGAGGTDTGLVTVTVTAVNDAPIAVDDTAATEQNTPVGITAATLLANDTDVDGGALSVTAVGSPVNGTVNLASGTATFTPTTGFTGSGSFQYTVSDGAGGTDTGLVTVNVSAAGTILSLIGGNSHICALLNGGAVKCWGLNAYGNLGLGDTNRRGDTPGEMGSNLPFVQLGTGRTAVALAAGGEHNCVLLDNSTLKCWGYNIAGQLGYGDPTSRGNGAGQMGDNLATVNLGTGRTAVQIEAGAEHTCAVLDNGQLKCWGGNSYGQLGLGDTNNRGDNPGEMGDALPAVDLGPGRTAIMVSGGAGHTCALLDNNTTKCWGSNFRGQLGLGDVNNRGDGPNEMGANLPTVDLGPGLFAVELMMGELHSCALMNNNQVKCWGFGSFGALGIGDSSDRGGGPNEMGANLPQASLGTGRHALSISGGHHTCALLDNLAVKCWGLGDRGQLGQESFDWLGSGPNQMGDNLPPVDLGTGVVADQISHMLYDACILTATDLIKCWGGNLNGQLGQGDVVFRGGNPGDMGDGLPFISIF